MKLEPLLKLASKYNPELITPFIKDYFEWADKSQDMKPYFYGKWSLKWILCQILEKDFCDSDLNVTIHHMLCELALSPNPEELVQFKAIKLVAFRPWKQQLNDKKASINVNEFPFFYAGGFKFIENNTSDNLTSLIFRRTNADGIIGINSETQSAMIALRANSKINENWVFTTKLEEILVNFEPGWKTFGFPRTMFINHGIESKTPSRFGIESLGEIIKALLEVEN